MNNHGQVGEALYLKYSSNKFKGTKHGDILSVEYLNNCRGVCASVPIHIDDSTEGNYECVCEFGTEIH